MFQFASQANEPGLDGIYPHTNGTTREPCCELGISADILLYKFMLVLRRKLMSSAQAQHKQTMQVSRTEKHALFVKLASICANRLHPPVRLFF